MEKRLISFIKYAPIIILPLFVSLVFYLIVSGYQKTLQSNFQIYKDDLIEKQKSLVKTNVDIAIQIFDNQIFLTENKDKALKSFLNLIKNINNKANDYYFIFNTKGDVIIHSFLDFLEGQNLFIIDDKNYNQVIKLITQNYEYDRFLNYSWLNPSTNEMGNKISFVKQIPNTDLIIGSGFYLDDIQQNVLAKKFIEEKQYHKSINFTLALALLFVLLSFILSYIISKLLLKKFRLLNQSLKDKSNELKKLNNELEQKVVTRTNRLKEAYKKMKDLASTDDLTKTYNRFHFFKVLYSQLSNVEKNGALFSLVMFDLDNFKNINDTYGHDIGDFVLQETCRIVEKSLRQSDTFARIGGEEFLILLPETSLNEAFLIAQRVRKSIETHTFKNISNITISMGVTEANKKISSVELLKKVDIALYKAKKEGRNRVIAFKN